MRKRLAVFILLIVLTAALDYSPLAKAYTTEVYQIDESHDDAGVIGSNFNNEFDFLTLKTTERDVKTWFRFKNVNCSNSELSEAILSVYTTANVASSSPSYVTVYAFKTKNVGSTFAGAPVYPITSAYASFNVTDLSAGWKNITVTSLLNEVFSLYGWDRESVGFALYAGMGDPSTTAYAYDGNPSRSAKLYVTRYEDEDKPYNGGWDNGILYNSTDTGDMWEVWNGTNSGGIIGSTTGNPIHFFRYNDASPNVVQATSGIAGEMHTIFYHEGVIYASGNNNSFGYLYTSTNGGDTWIAKKAISPVPAGFIRMSINNATDVIHIAYVTSTSPKLYYNTYTIATNTLGSPLEIRSTGSAECYGIKYYNSKIWVVWGDGNRVWEMKKTGSTWSGDTDISTGANFPAYSPAVCFVVYGNDIHTVAVWNNNPLWNSRLVEPDLTTGSLKSMPNHHHLANNGARLVEGANKDVRFVTSVSSDPYGKPAVINDLITSKLTWDAASWSAYVIVASNTYTALSVGFETIFDPDNYAIAYSETAGNHIHVATGDASSWSVSGTYVYNWGYAPTDCEMVSFGAEGTHYYQFHFTNCTWLTPTVTPEYPDDPDDPEDPSGWDTEGIATYRNMKLFFLIMGLALTLFPILFMAGRPEGIHAYGASIIAILFGIALLLAFTQI